MQFDREFFFLRHPEPMWVFDAETLQFLDVNDAAIDHYGWSRAEFLSMDITDIRPREDVARLRATLAETHHAPGRGGIWRHLRKDGAAISVEITSHAFLHEGRKARLVIARDVSHREKLEKELSDSLERERAARSETELLAQRFRALFESVPEKILVLAPDGFKIVAVSDAYLEVTGRSRGDLIGESIFEVFPDDPADPNANGTRMVRASFERALASGRADIMAIQRYPIPRAGSAEGGFEERFWSPVNTPVKDAHGRIAWIFHQVEDVTAVVASKGVAAAQAAVIPPGDPGSAAVRQTQRLKQANVLLEREIADLHLAKRVLRMATWTVDLQRRDMTVTPELHAFLGTDAAQFDGAFSGFLALVHPGDRERVEEEFAAFERNRASVVRSRHRIVRPSDGRTIHVVAAGERLSDAAGVETVRGIVQDVSEMVEAQEALDRALRLNQIAGHAAGLGGWRYLAEGRRLVWTDETISILGIESDSPPDVDQVAELYVHEDRPRIREAFRNCVKTGIPFDEVLRINHSAKGQTWVRVIGEPVRDDTGLLIGSQGAFQDIDDLVQARERAAALSGQLAVTLENISDGFFTLDRDWRFGFVNARAGEMLRRSPAQLIGKDIWEEFPDAVGSNFRRSYERVVETGATVRFEEYFSPLDAWFQVNAYPAPDGLAVYFRDITEERRRDTHLRLLEAAIAQQNDFLEITEAGIEGPDEPRFVYVNQAFERITGYKAAEVLGRTPRLLQGPETDRATLDRLRAAIERGEGVNVELVNYRKDGKGYWTELDIRPLRDPEGQLTHFIAVGRDITERKKASEALRASEERFRLIARATSEVIWDWNTVEARTWWSDGMSAVFGHAVEMEGSPPGIWESNIHPEEAEQVIASLYAALKSDAENWSARYRFRRSDGNWANVQDRAFFIRDAAGQATRVLGTMTDITENLQLEDRLRQSQKLEAVGQLTGGVAHDFNNLLTVILGNAEQMAEELERDHRLRAMAEMTASAAMRGAELTSRLLAFARRQALQPKVLRLNRLVAGMEGLVRRTLTEEIDIEVVQSGNLWPTEVDPGQLEVALLNLVINARDAMPGGGRMTIETANARLDQHHPATQHDIPAGQYVMVAVSDTGTGMPADVAARAFDPFFTTKEVGKGSGLGLSMVYGFVRQSNGHVRIYSEPGEGTTVKLYFPRATHADESAPAPPAVEQAMEGREHVLVVEDDEMVRKHVVSQLTALGYRVSAAEDGRAAMAIIGERDDIDLLFTDIVMPGGMSGRQLADAARDIRPGLRVLFTSGYTENSIVHHGRLDPGVDLLQKPYRRKELARRLRRVFDG